MTAMISIIVTSYTTKRLKDIMELLDSIKGQTYPDIETIFIVERSEDLMAEITAQKQNMRNLRVVYNDGEPGLSAARNLGIKEAKGEIVAFIDDDAVLSPEWAEATAKAYAGNASVIGVTGPILPLWEESSMAWFPREFYWIFSCTYYDWTEPTEVRNGYGTNISFKREAFDAGSLFLTNLGAKGGGESGKHELSGDETEFSIRVREKTGKQIFYYPDIKVQHRVYKYRLTSRFIAKRGYWEGYTKAVFNRSLQNSGVNGKLLNVEYSLLRRIMFKLFPEILKGFFSSPAIAWRKLCITVVVLTSVAAGYTANLLKIYKR